MSQSFIPFPASRTFRSVPESQRQGGFVRMPRKRQLIPAMTTYMPPQYIDSGKAEYGNVLNNPVLERDIPMAVASTGRVRRIPTWSTQDQWWAGPDLITNEVNEYPDQDPTLTAGTIAASLFVNDMNLYPVNNEGYNTTQFYGSIPLFFAGGMA